MNSIELKNLTKRYGKFYAVDNLEFEIKQGAFVGFLGVNGAGKSTTVNMLSTILTPDSGEAYLCGYKLGKEDMAIRKSKCSGRSFYGKRKPDYQVKNAWT